MSISPYTGLERRAFWKTGVGSGSPFRDLYHAKVGIEPATKIATAGSCFAQHVARHLRARGYNVIDYEPPPPGLSKEARQRFGYGIYSARYGNIYLVRQLKQLVQEALFEDERADIVWEKDGRFFDALRPGVEPNGHPAAPDVLLHREGHLRRVKSMLTNMDVLIFTLGLTEGWVHRRSGTVYPTAPGTIAGSFDGEMIEFTNFSFGSIFDDFVETRSLIKSVNASAQFILTVSPVPLAATASGAHVLAATTYSKSVLRAVAGQLSDQFEDVDYFPSYEIVTSPCSGGGFFAPDWRSVTPGGVDTVMQQFFEAQGASCPDSTAIEPPTAPVAETAGAEEDEAVCEEKLLEAFAR